jgi:hypothetical protein
MRRRRRHGGRMQQKPTKPQVDERPRIVDLIAEGLSLALMRPWLLLMPILLDIVLWIGVRIEPAALMNSMINLIDDANIDDADEVISTLQDLSTANMTQLGALFVPSMLLGTGGDDVYQWIDPRVWSPGSGAIVLVAIGLVVVGALMSMIYIVPIANAVIGRKLSLGDNTGLILRAWARMLLFIGLCIGAMMIVVVPTAIVSAIFPPLLAIFSSLMLIAGIAALLLLYFVFDAIVIADVGPIKAIKLSVEVVRRNLRPVIGLVLATLLLTTGIPEIATSLLDSLPGLIVAVLLQALIATGAAAASMLFFVDRLRQLQPELLKIPQSAPAFELSR